MPEKNDIESQLVHRRLPTARPQTVRDLNRAAVLDLIRRHQPLSRADLARLTNIHRSNISLIVDDLQKRGLLLEERAQETSRGRTPHMLSLERTKYGVLGANVRWARTTIALSSLSREIENTFTFSTPKEPEEFLDMLEEAYLTIMQRKSKQVRHLAISVPGMANKLPKGKQSIWTPGLPRYSEWDMASAVQKRLGIATTVGNNAEFGAKALLLSNERRRKQQTNDFVFLIVGDIGIGSGVVIHQNVYSGYNASFAGEVGHSIIDRNGPLCRCGRHGCWNLYVSDMATLRRYNPKIKFTSGAFQTFLQKVNEGDADAVAALRITAEYLCLGLSNVAVMMNPERIILGGEIVRCWPSLQKELDSMVFLPHHRSKISPTEVPVDTLFLQGAIESALDHLFSEQV